MHMQFDHGRQSLFFIALAALILLHGALRAGAQTPAHTPAQTPPATSPNVKALSYLQYHQEAEKIDEKAHTVDLNKFLELRAKKGTVVLDLRSPAEYAQSHIEGAILFGADISKENLAKAIPSKNTTVLLYCAYSLMPTRMIALTNVSLPQFILQGYKNTYKLGPIWENTGSWQASQKNLARLPMVPKK
jgi:hypothetical protein